MMQQVSDCRWLSYRENAIWRELRSVSHHGRQRFSQVRVLSFLSSDFLFPDCARRHFRHLAVASYAGAFGVLLLVLLQKLALPARTSLPAMDDKFFNSEMSVSLYLLPIFPGGLGSNVISHI